MNTTKLTIQWIFVALLFPLVSTGSNTMSIPPVQVGANQTATIQIKIDNDDTFVGFQADIPLPGQFSFVTGSAQLNTLRSNGHVISANQLPGNILRLIAYSLSNSAFLGDTGMVAQLDVQAATVPGWYALYLNNAIIGDTSSVNILTSAVSGSISLMASDINLMSSELNFGEIPLLQTQSKSLTIQNTGNQTLEISAIQFDSPWFSVNGSDSFNVLPGASQTITLVFDSHVKGTYSNTINIFSNDPDEAIKSAQLNAFAFAVNELHTGSAFAYSGDLVEFSFSINNMDAFTGFQFDVVLPPVMTYVNSSAVLSQRSNGHMASASMVASNTLRVVAYSINNSIFSGVLGDVISLSFFVNGTGGYYPLSLSNVIIGDTLGENVVSDYFNGQLQIAAADIHGSTNIAFGEVSVTDSALISWSIYNIGTDTLVIENIIFTTIDFWTETTIPFNVLPGDESSIPVYFNSQTEGAKSGAMKLFSNDPDENPYSLNLSAQAYYPNFIHLETIETFRNSIVEIPVFVDNYESFVGFQFDFHFPDSLDHNSALDNLSSRAQDHILHSSVLTDNSIRVFSFSLTQSEFTGNSGEVVNLSFNTNSIPNGSYNLQFSNAILGDSNSSNILYSSSNGVLVIADSISIVSNIYQPSYMGATDAQIDISVSGGTSPYNITWSTGDNILSIQNLDTGTYSVTVTDFYGKSKISVFEIVDPEYELQEVSLLNGWGLISTYLVPMQNSITVIFSEVEDNLIIMKNETGAVYWPFFGLDMIDSLTLGRGYQVNMSQADTLEIIGYGVEPENTLLNLPLGWSIIGYLKRTEAPANVLLSSIVNDILILKDENGMVYWPYFGLNLIGNMKRGKGYQLSLSSPVQFSFPAD